MTDSRWDLLVLPVLVFVFPYILHSYFPYASFSVQISRITSNLPQSSILACVAQTRISLQEFLTENGEVRASSVQRT